MIKLNTHNRANCPTMRPVSDSEEPGNGSFLDKMSAYAHTAIGRLKGFRNQTGTKISRMTKMLPALMLAVFAFNTARAQVYNNTFDGAVFAATHLGYSTPTGGNIVGGDGCIGSNGYSFGGSGYNAVFTFNVDPGYQLSLTEVSVAIRAHGGVGSGSDNLQIKVNGINYGTPYNAALNSTCFNVIRTQSPLLLTGTFTVSFTGNSSSNVGIDDIQLNGAISCNAVAALAVNGTSSCTGASAGTGSITVGGATSAGVNYQLYKDNVATGTNANGNGGVLTFAGLPAGTYTVKGVNTVDNSCVTNMTGSFIIRMAPSNFTVSGSGNVCASPLGSRVINLSGSQVGVNYQLKNGASNVGAAVAGNGAPLNWNVNAAGTYTIEAVGSSTVCAATMSGSAVVTVSQPTASILGNNGELCYGPGSDGVWQIQGTPYANIIYNISGPGVNLNGNIDLQPDGTASITYNDLPTNSGTSLTKYILTLSQATLNSGSNNCTQTLSGVSNTLVLRPEIVMSEVPTASSQTICSGGSFSNYTVTVTGSNPTASEGRARIVYYRLNGSSFTANLNATTASFILDVSSLATTNAGPASLVHTVYLDSAKYTSAPSCVSTNGAFVKTLTVKALPNFTFHINGSAPLAVSPAVNNFCVPVSTITFNINVAGDVASAGSTFYTIVKDGNAMGSGTVTSGTASLVAGVNFNPTGHYVVTLTGPGSPACPRVLEYDIMGVNKPSFVYTIAGQNVTHGSVIQLCANTTTQAVLTAAAGLTYNVGGLAAPGASPIGVTGIDNWSFNSGAAGTFTGQTMSVNAGSVVPGGCDSMITFTIQVNPRPATMDVVKVNATTLNWSASAAANEVAVCENTDNSISVTGAPGSLIEMFSNYGRSLTTNTSGSAVVPTQIGTYVIPGSGIFTYNFNSGPYNSATNTSSSSTDSRTYYRIEVKSPTTLCADTINFRIYNKQKPRVDVGWTISGAAAPGTVVAEGDTIKICYPAQLRLYFNRGASNDGDLNATINYVAKKDGVNFETGTISTTPSVSYYQMPVNQNTAGTYTLLATSSNGCDSLRTFYVKVYSSPKYTFKQGLTPNPTSITFCEGYAATKPISIVSDSAALSQVYTITRTGGSGAHTFTTLTGPLTATTITHILSTLGADGNAVGIHNMLLSVVSSPNGCAATHAFTVSVTPMPKPVLKANTITMVHGQTYTYCQEEIVEYRISGVPAGSTYSLTRTNSSTPLPVMVASGTTVAAEQSVITFMMAPNTAGLYELKVTNTGSSTCDSVMSFTVNVNDRPDISALSVNHVTICNGNNNGSVTYTYTSLGVNGNNLITRKLYRNGSLVSNQDNTNLTGTITNPNLIAGNYMLVVANASCSDTALFVINDPASAVVLTVTNTGAACGSNNGTATLSFSGGVGPYYLQIFDPSNLPVSTQSNVAATANWNVYDLAPGIYTVEVTDQLGCKKTVSFTINSCTLPDLFPNVSISPSNFSLTGTTPSVMTLSIYNSGQTVSSGNISTSITLPAGFALSGSVPGWTLTQVGMTSIYMISTSTVNIAPGIASPAVLSYNIVKTGTPGAGFYSISTTVSSGSGNEINSSNNSTVSLFNVTP